MLAEFTYFPLPKNPFLKYSLALTMIFMYDIAWWISAATALAAASIPAFLKPLKALYLLLALALWSAAVIRIALMQGALAAIAGGGVSLLWGLLLMLFSLLFSGVRQMANRRYN